MFSPWLGLTQINPSPQYSPPLYQVRTVGPKDRVAAPERTCACPHHADPFTENECLQRRRQRGTCLVTSPPVTFYPRFLLPSLLHSLVQPYTVVPRPEGVTLPSLTTSLPYPSLPPVFPLPFLPLFLSPLPLFSCLTAPSSRIYAPPFPRVSPCCTPCCNPVL